MLLFICPKGHRFGIGGYGEDLSNNVTRPAETCPVCRFLSRFKALLEDKL